MRRQKKLFRAPRKGRSREVKPRPATKDCPQCDNLKNRIWRDPEDGTVTKMPPRRCGHKGRPYAINGVFRMVLCVCCVTRMKKKSPGIGLREI